MEGKKLRIAMIHNEDRKTPSYVIRNEVVGRALEKRGHKILYKIKDFDLDIDDYDVFIFNRHYEKTMLKYITFLKARGKKIVYELDDNYEAVDENTGTDKKSLNVLSMRELVELADLITVSTPELKAEIIKMNDRAKNKIEVIPNALCLRDYYNVRKQAKKLRVGFQGSNVHIQDLLMIAPTIKELQKELDFEFHIFGLIECSFKAFNEFCKSYSGERYKYMDDFQALYEELKEINYKHTKTVDCDEFIDKLKELNFDIGLAPLTDTRFNRSKSCLKFYEYAATGSAVLASDVVPYNTELGKEDLVKNRHAKWKAKLKRLIEDEEYRIGRMSEQMHFVMKHRNINEVVKRWESIIFNLLKQ